MKSRDQLLAAVAVVLLLFSAVVVWDVAADRERMATDADRQQAIDYQVPIRQAPGDYDGDAIPDATDQCPTRPETTNDFQDDDGCPDVIATTGAS